MWTFSNSIIIGDVLFYNPMHFTRSDAYEFNINLNILQNLSFVEILTLEI